MRVRQYSRVGIFVIATAGIGVTYWAVGWLIRSTPNYSEIEPGLYMGGSVLVPPPGTRAVLNLCEVEDSYGVKSHRWVPIPDAAPAPSLDWLREQVAFVAQEMSAGHTIFVHCRAGVSRSGLVVVAYYMSQNGWSRAQAMEFVRTRRPELHPNPAFMKLLLEWEQVLKEKPSIKS